MLLSLMPAAVAAAPPLNVVFDGDSVSVGACATPGNGPDHQLARLLKIPAKIANVAHSGRPVFVALELYQTNIAPRFNPAAINIIAFHAGDNDISHGKNAAETYTALTQYIAAAHTQGWKVIVSTELARPDWHNPAWQPELTAYNKLMLQNRAGADRVIDYAAIPGMSDTANRATSGYFCHDQVHPSDAGYSILAGTIDAAIQSIIQLP